MIVKCPISRPLSAPYPPRTGARDRRWVLGQIRAARATTTGSDPPSYSLLLLSPPCQATHSQASTRQDRAEWDLPQAGAGCGGGGGGSCFSLLGCSLRGRASLPPTLTPHPPPCAGFGTMGMLKASSPPIFPQCAPPPTPLSCRLGRSRTVHDLRPCSFQHGTGALGLTMSPVSACDHVKWPSLSRARDDPEVGGNDYCIKRTPSGVFLALHQQLLSLSLSLPYPTTTKPNQTQ